MGEALMFRAGSGSGGGQDSGNYELCTQIFESNGTFVMPSGVKNNQVYVRIFGGGAGGASCGNKAPYCGSGGGGGGWMANGCGGYGSAAGGGSYGKGGDSSNENASSPADFSIYDRNGYYGGGGAPNGYGGNGICLIWYYKKT